MLARTGFVGRQIIGSGGFVPGPITSPSLDISFLSGQLDPSMTFTRGAGPATYFDATGTMQTVGANVPRFDNDPVTLAPRGLLIEEARTNQVQNSVPSAGQWGIAGTGTRTFNAGLVPDGTTNAALIVADATNTTHGFQVAGVSARVASTIYTASVFVKAGTSAKGSLSLRVATDWVGGVSAVAFDLSVPSASISGGATAVSIAYVGNGWFRVSVTATTTAAPTGTAIWTLVQNAASQETFVGAGESVYFWGMQMEVGQFPTSYIPTVGAAVARAADVCNMPVGAWFNLAQGTLVVDGMMPQVNTTGAAANQDIGGFDDGTLANCYIHRCASAAAVFQAIQVSGGTGQPVAAAPNAMVALTPFKSALTYNGSVVSACLNGGGVVASAAGTPPVSITRLNLSAIRQQPQNGYKSRIRYWPRVLSNTELQQATT